MITRPSIPALLRELGRRRMTNVLVEGGSEVLGTFADADAIDEFHVYVAPILVGGNDSKGPIGGRGVDKIALALSVDEWEVEQIGDDVLLHGWRSRDR